MATKVFVLVCLTLLGVSDAARIKRQAECPDDDPTLVDWNPGDNPAMDAVIDGVSYKLVASANLRTIQITNGGRLVFADDGVDITLRVKGVLIENNGEFHVGSESCRYQSNLNIVLWGRLDDPDMDLPGFGRKVIGCAPTGTIEIHGPDKLAWTKLAATLLAGDVDHNNHTVLTLVDDPLGSWAENDEIVIASSDYDMNHAEIFTVIACPQCKENEIMIQGYPLYTHWGEITDGIDMRAEVGILTRNVKIQGEMEDACYGDAYLCPYFDQDIFGGQTQVLVGFKSARFEGIEMIHMGQQGLGNYPIHFHRTGDAKGAYARQLSIHDTLSRCVTIHATNNLLVEDVVGYNSVGHCFFLEDGNEQNNTLRHNLGLVTKAGSLLPSDRNADMCTGLLANVYPGYVPDPDTDCKGVSTFWIAHPDNYIIDNAAAGSEEYGFFFIFHRVPTGPSAGTLPPFHGERSPLPEYSGNTAHSNFDAGLHIDRGVKVDDATQSDPREFLALEDYARYSPHQDRNLSLPRIPAILEGHISYKNHQGFHVRGGDIFINNAKSGDDTIGVTMASLGTLPYDVGAHQEVTNSLFVGTTANMRSDIPLTAYPQRGVEVMDGPILVDGCTFNAYVTSAARTQSTAISFVPENPGQMSPANTLRALTFDGQSDRFWFGAAGGVYGSYDRDGDQTQLLYDADGSVGGTANSFLVRQDSGVLAQGCTPTTGGASLCAGTSFGQVYMNMTTKTATVSVYPRNGDPAQGYSLDGANKKDTAYYPNTTNYQPVLVNGGYYTVVINGGLPDTIVIAPHNFPTGGFAGLGFDLTAASSLSLTYEQWDQLSNSFTDIGDMATGASINDVSNDPTGRTYYWAPDKMLYIKSVQQLPLSGYNYCADNGCQRIRIRVIT